MGGIENVCMVKEGAREEGQAEVWAAKEMEKTYKCKVCRERKGGRSYGHTRGKTEGMGTVWQQRRRRGLVKKRLGEKPKKHRNVQRMRGGRRECQKRHTENARNARAKNEGEGGVGMETGKNDKEGQEKGTVCKSDA